MWARRHLASRLLLLAAVLTLGTASVALALLTSGTYTGNLTGRNSRIALTFKYAHTKVTAFSIDGLPFYCQGGSAPETIKFANAKVSRTGTFSSTASVRYATGPDQGQVDQKFSIKGRIKSGGKASGTIKTTFVFNAPCSGSESWTAKT